MTKKLKKKPKSNLNVIVQKHSTTCVCYLQIHLQRCLSVC